MPEIWACNQFPAGGRNAAGREFLWQNFVSTDFSVTSRVKYGTIHISVGFSDPGVEFDLKGDFCMRKRLCAIFLALTAAIGISGGTVFGAAKTTQVDTITLEREPSDEEVAVDLGWKTQQDKGRWIDKMGIGDDVNSLVLIINNLENNTDTVKTNMEAVSGEKVVRAKKKQLPGNSRLLYLSRTENGEWQENFSVNCYVSGGQGDDSEAYGVYRLESAFGSETDPGSLVPYQKLTEDNCWITDPEADGFGVIAGKKPANLLASQYVNLESMRAFSNFGMILKPEDGAEGYPALVVNCQQSGAKNKTLCGVQLAQSYVRMLIQSMDSGTRIMIAGEVEDLEGMLN